MGQIKKVVLDVLKPHKPTILEMASSLSDEDHKCTVNIKVAEVDEHTETLVVTLSGKNIDLEKISAKIAELGGSIHSIDEVEVSLGS
ncbi:MAG: hypothetical protein AMJ55_10410 [Gammaproteobacteria bacterium SG8_15]|nr:MAG: hypothetical protein AMJ55_10410 [Gammaproteobacteria bacterium SG8_15]